MLKYSIKRMVIVICVITTAAHASSAQDEWAKLVGEKFIKRDEFKFVNNQANLPNVLIYGDSISIHYTQEVRESLAAQANVYRLYRNGGESKSFVDKMNKMHNIMTNKNLSDHWTFNWDVIHFNVGLHD